MKNYLAALLVLVPFGAGAAEPYLSVTGLVSQSLYLTFADLHKFPVTHVAVTQASGRGPVSLDCTGVLLSAILQRAAVSFGPKNNASLARTLLVRADDGYAVSLSFGEIDPDYGHIAPIIATECSGKPLEAGRLIVPGDLHAGRAVSGVVAIEVK